MALKRHFSQMVDESLGAMNMPTRSEIRTLQNRLQETRRENKQLRHDLEDLREKLERLTSAAASSPVPPRKAAPKKKSVAKKKVATQRAAKGTNVNHDKNDS
jgi:cell division septum initiation protein DivIVA